MTSQEAQNVSAFMASMKLPDISNLPIELLRQGMAGMMSFALPPAGCVIEQVNAGGPEALWVSAVQQNANRPAAVLYLHGGAYSLGSPQTHIGITGLLSELSQIRILSVDYRLAPENPYPAAIEDAVSAYRWLLQQGVPAGSIVIGGDSAGGGLTFATLLKLKETGDPLPAAAFAMSPWVDLDHSGETIETNAGVDPMFTKPSMVHMAKLYAQNADLRLPFISPLYGNMSGLPPVLIHVGTNEMLHSDSLRMAAALKKAGVDCTIREWEDLFHVFHSVVYIPEARIANEEIAAFIKKHIKKVD